MVENYDSKTGLRYNEYYLYSEKAWEMAPVGTSSFDLAYPVMQNAPIVITPSGSEVTTPTDPWAKVSGVEKYNKVGFRYFDLLDDGSYNPDVNEFSLSPYGSGTIVFNGPLKENVYIEYESGPSGYYIMDGIDYNPIRNEATGGFLHFSKTTEPAFMELTSSRSTMRADGWQGCKLTAIVYDEDYDRVPGSPVVFELRDLLAGLEWDSGRPSGVWSELGSVSPYSGTSIAFDASGSCVTVTGTTNLRGEAYANYGTFLGKTGVVKIKSYYPTASGVSDEIGFYQFYLQSDPYTLDVSQLDTKDYLA